MKTIIAVLLMSLSIGITAQNLNQEIEVYNFKEFQQLINNDDDVLYVVNFWASWCKPCVHELPDFDKVASEYEHTEVKFLLVSLDYESYLESHVKPLVKRKKIEAEVILLNGGNPNSWIPKISRKWGGSIPATLFINNKQKINKFYEQPFNYTSLKKMVDKYK